MAGHSKNYSRHIYVLDDEKTSYRGYKLESTLLQNVDDKSNAMVLPVYIRIEFNRGCNNTRECERLLRIKDADTWEKTTLVTRLQKVPATEIFEGNFARFENDRTIPESLILFQFENDFDELAIDVFKDFYIQDVFEKRHLIRNHEYHYNKKAAV